MNTSPIGCFTSFSVQVVHPDAPGIQVSFSAIAASGGAVPAEVGVSPTGPEGRSRMAGNELAPGLRWADERLGIAKLGKKNLRKVFPDHWSFMLGEIALYSFRHPDPDRRVPDPVVGR
jgi:hypothetical protein